MATRLNGRPVTRIVETGRGVRTVTITPQGVSIRGFRSRTSYGPVSWAAIEDLAAKISAAAAGTPVPAPRRVQAGAR